jgi:hypothetical protein
MKKNTEKFFWEIIIILLILLIFGFIYHITNKECNYWKIEIFEDQENEQILTQIKEISDHNLEELKIKIIELEYKIDELVKWENLTEEEPIVKKEKRIKTKSIEPELLSTEEVKLVVNDLKNI